MIDQLVKLEQVMPKSCYIGKYNIVQTRIFEAKCNEKCFTNVLMLNVLDALTHVSLCKINVVDLDRLDVLKQWKNMQER
jgi:hypothetical protein